MDHTSSGRCSSQSWRGSFRNSTDLATGGTGEILLGPGDRVWEGLPYSTEKHEPLWATLKWSRMILATRTSLGFRWSRKTPVLQEVSCQGSMLRYPQMALVLELLTMNPMGMDHGDFRLNHWFTASKHPRSLLRTCRACSD